MTDSAQIHAVSGTAVYIPGDDIDTDRIIPARFMTAITFDSMGEYLFYDVRFDASGQPIDHPLNDTSRGNPSIMVVGRNFGCGSSREHAPQAIYRFGFRAIIGQSFSEIFAGNCRALGIPTAVLTGDDWQSFVTEIEKKSAVSVSLDMDSQTVCAGSRVWPVEIQAETRFALLTGQWNSLAMLKMNESRIAETANTLPYFRDFC